MSEIDDAAAARIAHFFEHLRREDLGQIGEVYAQDALFKDPFNEVRGIEAVHRVYAHMFDALHDPRFVVTRLVAQHGECWLAWEFRFRFKSFRPREVQLVRGATHLLLGPDGRIVSHRDYWDAAEEVYEKLPVIGAVMRRLKRRAAA
jgi:ketosteroid isomerase-like protein